MAVEATSTSTRDEVREVSASAGTTRSGPSPVSTAIGDLEAYEPVNDPQ